MKVISIMLKLADIVRQIVKKFDLFSQKIMFTYKGESSFSTFLGGFTSLIILTIVAVYTGFLVQVMVNRQNSNNSLSTEVVDLNIHDENYYPAVYESPLINKQ